MGSDSLFEILHTTRAMRRLKPDPIPDELLRQILEAAVCAPNGGNHQTWSFIVVKDPDVKKAVQFYYRQAFDEIIGPQYESGKSAPGVDTAAYQRQHEAVRHLTEHFHEAPVWIALCLDEGEWPPSRWSGASIYPAAQNILLAARALGLGATLTTRHLFHEDQIQQILGLPPTCHCYAIIPLGYPRGRFGPVRRRPLEEVVFENRWGLAASLDH